jgi:hypothetical protein
VSQGQGTAIDGYIVNGFQETTNAPNQLNLQNFIALAATATISGNVRDNIGTNVSGVTLTAGANVGGNNYQSLDATTDANGNYTLAVASGQWDVQFLTGGSDSDNLDQQGYEDIASPHMVTVPPTNAVLNITVYPIGTPFITVPQRFANQQFNTPVISIDDQSVSRRRRARDERRALLSSAEELGRQGAAILNALTCHGAALRSDNPAKRDQPWL